MWKIPRKNKYDQKKILMIIETFICSIKDKAHDNKNVINIDKNDDAERTQESENTIWRKNRIAI